MKVKRHKMFSGGIFLFIIYIGLFNYVHSDDETTSFGNDNLTTSSDSILNYSTTTKQIDNSTYLTYPTSASNLTNSTNNSSSSDDYYYQVYVYEDVAANDTSNASKFHFSGDDQPRPGIGINLGWITSDMDQWVFTNKFKHAL